MKTKTIQKQLKGNLIIFSGDLEEMRALALYLFGIGATDETEPTTYDDFTGFLYLDCAKVLEKLASWKRCECTDFLKANSPLPKQARIAKAREMAEHAAKHWIESLPDVSNFQSSARGGLSVYSLGVVSGMTC